MTGPFVLVAALAVALVLGLVHRARNGRFRAPGAEPATGAVATAVDDRSVLTVDDLGAGLGDGATLVQFSTAFCAPCRATRSILAEVAAARPRVASVEVDAEAHLDLVRRLDVRRTPTVLLLDAGGRVVTRTSGLPRRAEVERLVDAVLAAG